MELRGDLVRSMLLRGDRLGDLYTITLVTLSLSGDVDESTEQLGDLSLLILPPLHERTIFIFLSDSVEGLRFGSGEDLREIDSCLPSSFTIVG